MADRSGTDTPTTTIMFTDLVGSTELLDRLGDDAANSAHQEHLSMLRLAVVNYGGREIKTLGDGLMVAFGSAVSAVRCSIAMQEAVSASGRGELLRVGIDAGEPIRLEDDLYGTPVVVAKRLCDLAQGGQILASDLVCRLVGRRLSARFEPLGPIAVKGLSQPLETVAIRWLESGAAIGGAGDAPSTSSRAGAAFGRRRALAVSVPVLAGLIAAVALLPTLGGSDSAIRAAQPVPNRPDGSVQVFRPAGAGYSAEHPCFALGGSRIIFTEYTGGYNNASNSGSALIYALPAPGGVPRTLVYHLGNAAVNLPGSCYSRSAGRLVYSSDVGLTDNIWTAVPAGLDDSERQVTCYMSPSLHALEPTWSPDGKFVVYALVNDRTPGRATLWRIAATSDCQHPLAPTEIVPGPRRCRAANSGAGLDSREPNWAPNGTQIAFQRQSHAPGGPINLWTVAPDGCGLTQLTRDSNQDTDPSWSPDSRSIVYSTDFGSITGTANLFIIAPHVGAPAVRLTGQCFYDGAPSWSPDGRWVAFESWPVANPSGNDIPTALWRIRAGARPARPSC